MFVSATPSKYEEEHEMLRTEQIIRPTGLLDPPIEVRPVEGQIDDLLGEINKEIEKENILDYLDDYSYYRHPNKFY